MSQQIPVFPLETPAMRQVEIVPVRMRDREMLMVRDPLGLIEGAALLVPDPILLIFMQMADGKTTTGEMAQKATLMSGQIIPAGILDSVAKQLDEALLLQSATFAAALEKRFEDFRLSPTRPSKMFKAEGMDRLKMLKELGEEFRRHKMSAISPPAQMDLAKGSVRGVLSPHIDYMRGGEVYAWAYKALTEYGTNADTFIILGTSHRGASSRYVATRKGYETPFGVVETETAIVDQLEQEMGVPICDEEFLHADEHTIELQVIYLKQVMGDRPFKIVPILVTPFDDMLEVQGAPRKVDPDVEKFITALRNVMEKYGDRAAIIGGVDLSHCGPEFGDEQMNDEARQKAVETGDKAALAALEKDGAEAFFESYRSHYNETKVCSLGTIYTVSEVLKGTAAPKLLTYQQSNTPDRETMVTFAAFAYVKAGMEAAPKSRIILLK